MGQLSCMEGKRLWFYETKLSRKISGITNTAYTQI